MRRQFSINQNSAFVSSSVAAEDIVPWLSAGQGTGDFATSGPSSHDDPKTPVERWGVGFWSGLSEGPPKIKDYQDDDPVSGDTELPRRLLDGRQGLQSSGRRLKIAF